MATGRVPTTANSPLTAKGDLFTYSTAPARLAVGNNGETIVADSSTSTGLRYQGSMAGGKNAIINGGFDIWQRGTSVVTAAGGSGGYAADRWQIYRGGFQSGATLTRQATGDTTNLPFIQYCARVQRDSGNTGTNNVGLSQNLETAMAIPYAGKTVTFSFYARAGANYSSASSSLSFVSYNGTGTDQNGTTGAGYTGGNLVVSQNVTLTTTWQRFTVTATIPGNSTEFYANFAYAPVGTAGANDYFEVTGVQVEVGSVATQFTRAGGTIQGELAACMRYAINLNYNPAGKAGYNTIANGYASSTTAARIAVNLPVAMRTQPSSITTSGNFGLDNISSVPAVTSITINQGGTTTVLLAANVASGLTSGQNLTLYSNNDVNANLILSAEL